MATVRTDFGVTVIGDPSEVDAYLDQFAVDTGGLRMSLPPARLQQAFGKGGLLASFGINTVAKYMSSHEIVATPADAHTGPAQLAELRLVARDPASKRFTSNTLVRPAEYALKGAAPELIAIEAALQHLQRQLDEIQRDIAEVHEDTQELLALANAQRLGDIYGHHRVLARHCAALDKGQTLTGTDWSSLAALGPVLEVGVYRLRAYLTESLKDMDPTDDVDARAKKLQSLVKRGEFVRTLGLLIVTQQSEYLWQRIRLERVRTAEPDALQQTLTNTGELLTEHLAADRSLADQLWDVLETYAVLRLPEVHHIAAGRRLVRSRRTLSEGVDRFVELRARQAADWGDLHDATFRDALHAASAQAGRLATGARRGISSGAANVAKWVDPTITRQTRGGRVASHLRRRRRRQMPGKLVSDSRRVVADWHHLRGPVIARTTVFGD